MPSLSSKSTSVNFETLEKKIRIRFKDAKLLQEAFTHKSYAIEHGLLANNERLEFLGDSIISAVVAHYLYKKYPNVDEGRLSKMKSQIVSRSNLFTWADDLDLGEHLLLSQGEEATGGRKRESLLGNVYESLVGALFLDQGFPRAQRFIVRQLVKKKRIIENDYKSKLQEIVQKKYKIPPTYSVINEEGPDHAKKFTLDVRIHKKILGQGEGRSKKEAEQSAARDALKNIRHDGIIE
ncbi:MAG: ribonuclease III [Elusimicrobia bacterium]|nr:ribonuclease III [Candidatus Obscuribacterium magneticum]